MAQKEGTPLILKGLYWEHPKGRALLGSWCAVYHSVGGSRIVFWNLPKEITEDQKDKAEQMAAEHGKGLTWEKLKKEAEQ